MRVRVWYDQGGAECGTPWAVQWGEAAPRLQREAVFTRLCLTAEGFHLRFDPEHSPKGWLEFECEPPLGVR